MKKILSIFLSFLAFTAFTFAQEEPAEEIPPVKKSSIIKELDSRIGLDAVYELPLGKLGDFITSNIGGQLNYEIDMPLSEKIRLGTALHGGVYYGPVKDDSLNSFMDLRLGAGVFARISAGRFYIQPELGYGLTVYLPETSKDAEGELSSTYTDQYLQAGLGFRFAPVSVSKGLLEFNFTPTYTLGPEKGDSISMIGARLGFLYTIKESPDTASARTARLEAWKSEKAAKEAAKAAEAEKAAAESEAKNPEEAGL